MTTRTVVQARWEFGLLTRNGEQVLLTIVIPMALVLGLTVTDLMPSSYADDRTAHALATVLTVSVISSAFTSLAIATAFERRSGALRFLATTPMTRMELLTGKVLATAGVSALSAAVVVLTSTVLGWRPQPGSAWAALVLLLGIAAFGAWGFALAGLLRAEAVLAVANGVFIALILFGGVIVPGAQLPTLLERISSLLPSGALAEGFTAALVDGSAPTAGCLVVLLVWFAVGATLAGRTFRWS